MQAEFEKNIPFALSVAESADDPDDPVSVVGRDAPRTSASTPSTSPTATRRPSPSWPSARSSDVAHALPRSTAAATRTARVSEWDGGERYGDENDDYYAEFRGARARRRRRATTCGSGSRASSRGARPRSRSERFTYTRASPTRGDDVLVIANEDYTGVNPTYPPGTNAPKYADAHVAAVEAAGYDADVWDVDAQGVPHDLGVLEPLRRRALVPRRQPAHPGPGGRADSDAVRQAARHRRSPSASSTSRWRSATTSTTAAS